MNSELPDTVIYMVDVDFQATYSSNQRLMVAFLKERDMSKLSAYFSWHKIKTITLSSVSRIGMRGRELMGGVGKTMMQSGGTFGTFMAIGMGIRCWGRRGTTSSTFTQLYSYGTLPITTTAALCLLDAVTLSPDSLVLSIKVQICQTVFRVDVLHFPDAANVLLRETDTKQLILSGRKSPPADTVYFSLFV